MADEAFDLLFLFVYCDNSFVERNSTFFFKSKYLAFHFAALIANKLKTDDTSITHKTDEKLSTF